MELLEIKEHVSLITPATYELSIKLNSELLRASFPDTRKRMDFYEGFLKGLSSEIYAYKQQNYPDNDLVFSTQTGNFFAYHENVQKKYLEILKALNHKTDDIFEQAKDAFSYSDENKMKKCITNFISNHFINYEIEKENSQYNRPRIRLFTLYEDQMQDTYCIGIKINEAEIKEQSSFTVLMRFDEFFFKTLSKNLYDFKRSQFSDERMTFAQDSGTLFTYSSKSNETFLNILTSLNKQSYEILTKLKELDSIYNNETQNYLETYISQHFLKWELDNQPKVNQEISNKKIKI